MKDDVKAKCMSVEITQDIQIKPQGLFPTGPCWLDPITKLGDGQKLKVQIEIVNAY